MDINVVILSGVIGIIASIVTAYVTTRLSFRQEKVKWERALAEKIAELKSKDTAQVNDLSLQFGIAFLIVEHPSFSDRLKFFIPPAGRLSVGRASRNDIVIPDMGISQTHAIFAVRDSSVFVADTGTTNAVFVNDKRVNGDCRLKDNDIITMGMQTRITFHTLRN